MAQEIESTIYFHFRTNLKTFQEKKEIIQLCLGKNELDEIVCDNLTEPQLEVVVLLPSWNI